MVCIRNNNDGIYNDDDCNTPNIDFVFKLVVPTNFSISIFVEIKKISGAICSSLF